MTPDIVERLRDIADGQQAVPRISEAAREAADLIDRLRRAPPVDTERLVSFAKEIIRLEWDGGVYGGDVQDIAEKHGLIVSETYDPAKHGEDFEGDSGDEIFVFAPWLKSAAPPKAKTDD